MATREPSRGEVIFVLNNLINTTNAMENNSISAAKGIERIRFEIDYVKELYGLDINNLNVPKALEESPLDVTPLGGRL